MLYNKIYVHLENLIKHPLNSSTYYSNLPQVEDYACHDIDDQAFGDYLPTTDAVYGGTDLCINKDGYQGILKK